MMSRRNASLILACAVATTALPPTSARAAGVEDLSGGALATGRAAAVGRANDFMATLLNPANLVLAPTTDAGFEFRLPFLRSCYDRARDPNVPYKEPGIYPDFTGSENFGDECNQAGPILAANAGFVRPLGRRLGFGVGIFTPAGVGNSRFGNDTILTVLPVEGERYTPTLTGTSSSTRQMGLAREGLTAYLMLGIGARIGERLRVGLSIGNGIASVYNKSTVSVLGGTFRDQEVLSEVNARSYFLPRAVASIGYAATDWLDLFAVGQYHGDLEATGSLTLTANGISGAPRTRCVGTENPGTHCRIEGVKVTIPFPTYEATVGARFSALRPGHTRGGDPMNDERFDVEVEGLWAQTSHVKSFDLAIHDSNVGEPGQPRIQFGNADGVNVQNIRKSVSIPKDWRDTFGVRVGSDVQVIPSVLTIRGGLSWSSRAVPPETMNIDIWPVRKIGLHLGATYRFRRFKFTAGYAHLFYERIDVPVGTGRVLESVTTNEAAATAVNEGSFRATQDVFSLQLNAAF
jgi:long-subunit fatty acid transport protein